MSASLSFGRLLTRSLRHHSGRSVSALLSLIVSAAIATALLTLFADLRSKLHHEFRSFGANVILQAAPDGGAKQASLPPDAVLRALRAAGGESVVVPFAYAVAATDRGTAVVVAGTDMTSVRRLNRWWSVDRWPTAAGDALLGARAARFVGGPGTMTLRYGDRRAQLRGVGTLHTGADEESRIYLPLAEFTAWTGVQPSVLEIQVPGSESTIDAALAHLREAFPGATVAPVRQLVEGESRIVERTNALMLGAMVLIALTVSVSVLATLSASVLERRRDFALMKALGSSQGQLLGLFLAEALLLAAVGVLGGWIAGSLAAWAISELNFKTATLPRVGVLPWVLVLNLTIALVAAAAPSRVLRRLEPAALLKGE